MSFFGLAVSALCCIVALGDGGKQQAAFVPPIQREVVVDGSKQSGYVLEFREGSDKTSFQCIATKGGLITGFALNGQNVLFDDPSRTALDGSIFWPSPQSMWGWPPPEAIDPTPAHNFTASYKVQVDEAAMAITLTSPIDDFLGIQVVKTFSLDLDGRAVHLKYSILNKNSSIIKVAPWEITRVPSGGLTFYPMGTSEPFSGKFDPLSVTRKANVVWFQHKSQPHDGKLFADAGSGWIGHASGGLALVKSFPRISLREAAPGEAPVEVYAAAKYVEVEAQGKYTTVPPGGRLDWATQWYLRALPADIPAAPSDGLAAFAASVATGSLGSPTPRGKPAASLDGSATGKSCVA